MKIAIILTNPALAPGGGVRVQGLMWRDGLASLGHTVDLINFWDENDWKSYDSIILLEFGGPFRTLMRDLSQNNNNIVVAPIIDPDCSKKRFKFYTKYWGNQKRLGLSSRFHDLYLGCEYGKLFLTRSNQETEYLSYSCDVPMSKIRQVPLSLRFTPVAEVPQKENFCLHVSRLKSENKNVARLIEAAKKYKFNLKLAGYLRGQEEADWLNNCIDGHKNIEYLGVLSDEQLCEYYKRAKVFALPSLVEGVGMVALEAAGYGCEVVLTKIGAPKDYFQGRAELVDPYSVDEIGNAVVKCINSGNSQPELLQFIKDNYTMEACSKKLENALLELVHNN